MILLREKNNALIKIYISAEKYITHSNDSTNKLQHLSVTIKSSIIFLDCHKEFRVTLRVVNISARRSALISLSCLTSAFSLVKSAALYHYCVLYYNHQCLLQQFFTFLLLLLTFSRMLVGKQNISVTRFFCVFVILLVHLY